MKQQYEIVVGLEVHLHIATATKAFCGCKNEFGLKPNSGVCPVCMGFPGSLPVLNEKYLEYAVKTALALNCKISDKMKFDRKNYFYPDLPKNYQISQYDMPLSEAGLLEIIAKDAAPKKIRIKRVHMEEDAGKLLHEEDNITRVDFNRSGTPLLEIVTEPDINSPEEAYAYLLTLKNLLEYLEVSDCDMEKGSLRCDANISIRPAGQAALGVKVEVKNMNSFKGVRAALEYEQKRQESLAQDNEKIIQETRLWDSDKKITQPMRTKEEAHDYRYFPDPDLVPFEIDPALIKKIKNNMPQLPAEKKKQIIKDYGISEYDAGILISDKAMAEYFLKCAQSYNQPKIIANWIISEILKYLNSKNMEFRYFDLPPAHLTDMLKMMDSGKISGKIAKDVLSDMITSKKSPQDIVKEKGLLQISDETELRAVIKAVLRQHAQVTKDYKSGKEAALSFLVGQAMKATKGKANPGMVNKLLKEEMGNI
ncbi:MAG: Asp-tRNA(Asn)/Glu-tRNA(Gln) amidotransferase subunit GatB [Candidatus Omnitrophica bacterium]|nr:Asp-tRNA(Asn)/Glu-tRNA(Gln) amidotransferase subunit GatB [Candidatus Omnitrophota bacterium]